MKRLGLWICLWAGALAPVYAQLTVELSQTQEQFLPGETMRLAVRITNLSGQTLQLGAEPDWLTFTIETQQGSAVPQISTVPVVGAFSLESSEIGTKRVDIAPYFALANPGTYRVTATVKVKEWTREITSAPRTFDVITGVKLWEQAVGVPKAPNDPPGDPETRRYILQQANYIRGQIRLYLRVTDASGSRPIRVVTVGNMLSLSRPEHLIDSASDLHVLFQNGPHSFSYSIFNPGGDLKIHQTYEYLGTRPRLQTIEQGKVVVAGGERRIANSDVPPPPPLLAPEGPKPLNGP